MWRFRLRLLEKLLRQMRQSCSFLFSWTSICISKESLKKNLASHRLHLCVFLFSWTLAVCFLRLPAAGNFWLQISHSYGVFFSCTDSIWLFKWLPEEKIFIQKLHVCDLIFYELRLCVFSKHIPWEKLIHKFYIEMVSVDLTFYFQWPFHLLNSISFKT